MKNEFGSLLKEWREESGLRMFDLAQIMGWSVVYLSDIERGRRNPPLPETIKEICAILQKDPDLLLELADLSRERL